MDLVNELLEKRKQMKPALEHLRKKGYEFARAETKYKIALRQEVLRERFKQTPVGVIDKIIYGEEDIVAPLREKRNTALTDYEVAKELIMMLKADIKMLDNQIAREWSNEG